MDHGNRRIWAEDISGFSEGIAGKAGHSMTIGVVIPCYQIRINWLREAVQSVVAQDAETEIVVVDDGGDDTDIELIWKPAIRLPVNRGIGIARNIGAAYLNTDYLLFLDADDTLHPGALTTLLTSLEQQPKAAFSYGNFTQAGALIATPLWDASELTRRNVASYCNLWKRQAFWSIGGYSAVEVAEDWEIQRRATKAGLVGAHVDAPIFDHRLHENNKWAMDSKKYGGLVGVANFLREQ
jgi:glycosyltransferase involved in cell wall biosynthesis